MRPAPRRLSVRIIKRAFDQGLLAPGGPGKARAQPISPIAFRQLPSLLTPAKTPRQLATLVVA